MKTGDIVFAPMQRSDGGEPAGHYGMVTDVYGDTGALRVLFGSSRKAVASALLPEEFLVSARDEMRAMGLCKPTRFQWRRQNWQWITTLQVIEVVGRAPDKVLGRAFRAAKAAGVL